MEDQMALTLNTNLDYLAKEIGEALDTVRYAIAAAERGAKVDYSSAVEASNRARTLCGLILASPEQANGDLTRFSEMNTRSIKLQNDLRQYTKVDLVESTSPAEKELSATTSGPKTQKVVISTKLLAEQQAVRHGHTWTPEENEALKVWVLSLPKRPTEGQMREYGLTHGGRTVKAVRAHLTGLGYYVPEPRSGPAKRS
jgi:hypothetical protein